jgi:hypothetical protein
MQEMIRTNQEKMEVTIHSMWSELDETIQHRIENDTTHINHERQSPRRN